MSNLVNVLYVPVLVSIFSEWFSELEYCALDSAYCNKNLRQHFLAIFSKCTIKNVSSPLECEILIWIRERGLGLTKIDLRRTGFKEWPILEEIILRTNRIDHLIVSCPQYAARIVGICSRISSFHFITESVGLNHLQSFMGNMTNMYSLTIDGPDLSPSFCEFAASAFPELREFRDNCGGSVGCIVEKCANLKVCSGIYCPEFLLNIRRGSCLQSLKISSNFGSYWDNADLFSIADNCPSLTDLSVGFKLNELSVLYFIKTHPQLVSLELFSSLSELCMKSLGATCKQLTCLNDIRCGAFTDAGLLAVTEGCCQLRVLNISFATYVSDSCIASFARSCRNLRELHARGTNISESTILLLLDNCPYLHTLYSDGAQNFQGTLFPVLSKVSVKNIDFNTRSVFVQTVHGYVNLPFSGSDPANFQKVAKLCPSLTRVAAHAGLFNDDSLRAFLAHCPLLKKISFNQCQISENCILDLAKCKQRLTSITLTHYGMRDPAVLALVKAQPQVTELRLLVKNITDKSLEYIALHCKQLKRCEFQESQITSAGVATFLLSCSSVRHLTIFGCPTLTSEFLFELIQSKRALLSLSVTDCQIAEKEEKAFLDEVTGDIVSKFVGSTGTFYPV